MPRICGCSGSFGASYCWQNRLRMTFKRGSTLGAAAVMAALYFFLYSLIAFFIAALPTNEGAYSGYGDDFGS